MVIRDKRVIVDILVNIANTLNDCERPVN